MSISRVISICILLLLICGCGERKECRHTAEQGLYSKVMTYWDGVETDSMAEDSLEQFIVDYLYLISYLDGAERIPAWEALHKHIADEPNRIIADYLGQHDSPLYSPELLEEYLVNLLKYSKDEEVVFRTQYLLTNIRKNRPGERIADLKITVKGERESLRRIIANGSGDCLLLFYDPDCESCEAAFETLKNIDRKAIRIITISITETTKHEDGDWISAKAADEDELDEKFYFGSMPSIYLVTDKGIIKDKDLPL